MFQELARLFSSPARVKLLKYFVTQPDARVEGASVASTVGISRAAADSELRALTRLGVLSGRRQGKTTFYSFDKTFPLEDAVRTFLEETTLPDDAQIVQTFRGVRGLTLMVATGFLAHEPRGSVDLLIITRRPHDSSIEKAVRKLEALAALPVRYAVLEADDYKSRLESYDRLLRDVFEYNHRVIYGRK